MSATNDAPYTIIGAPVYRNQYNETLQKVETGWVVQAQWKADGAVISVFVPANVDLASTADQLIRAQGEQLDALHSL